jgi:hypothetical protein
MGFHDIYLEVYLGISGAVEETVIPNCIRHNTVCRRKF